MSLVDKRVFFALLSCFMSKKSSFPSDEEITQAMAALDQSGDGTINFEEFAAYVIPVIVALASE